MQVRNQVSFGHGSSVGMVRETNEDYHRVKLFQTAKGQLSFLAVADGCIVGSDLKVDGYTWNPVDAERVRRFIEAARA